MNRRRLLIGAVLVLTLALVIVWLTRETEVPGVPSATTTTPTSAPTASAMAKAASATPEPDYAQLKPKKELMREALSLLNHKDIEFYGKVVDQSGAPVAGADVNGQVIYNSGVASGVSKPETVTDASGLFSFKGLKGRTLDFNIVKAGYEFMPEGDAFDYTELVPDERRHHPNARNPVLLKMWKLQGAEPLIFVDGKSFYFMQGEPEVRIDLTTGKRVESGGDLVITMKHEDWPPNSVWHPYDWSATVRAMDGGLIETNQRVMNLAPEDGYVAEIVFSEKAVQRPFVGGAMVNLYVKSRGNIFSKVKLELHPQPGQPTSSINIRSWLNPKDGSRNLEFDATKRVIATK